MASELEMRELKDFLDAQNNKIFILEEALKEIACIKNGPYWDELDTVRNIAKKALGLE